MQADKTDSRFKQSLAKAFKKNPLLRQTYESTPWLREAESLTDVTQMLKHENVEVRRTAIYFLGHLGDKRAAPALIDRLLHDSDNYNRGNAADALGFLGSKRGVLPLLDTLLHDPEVFARERAASGLRWMSPIKDDRIIDGLISAMANHHEEPIVREMVADAISYYDVHKAAPVLTEALNDPSPNVRYWSSAALTSSRYAPAIPNLERLAMEDTAICCEPDTNGLVNGSVCARAAGAMIQIKRDLGISLTDEEKEYSADW